MLGRWKPGSDWRNLHVTAAILRWLADLQEALRPESGSAEGDPKTVHRVLAAQEWIGQRLDQDAPVAEWAAACGFNPDYFGRLFKAHTGMTPEGLADRNAAPARLAPADLSGTTVEEVAERCGFNCPFHFSRTFKRRFGIAPASYRRVRQVRGFAPSWKIRKGRSVSGMEKSDFFRKPVRKLHSTYRFV